MSLKTWIATFWRGTECKQLTIGSSVKTPFGPGKVTGGNVHVMLDAGYRPPKHPPVTSGKSVNVSTDLNKIELL